MLFNCNVGFVGEAIIALWGTILWPSILWRKTCQSLVVGSHHTQRIISPLTETSHPVSWKNNLQPTSVRVAADSRLLVGPGMCYACLADWESLDKERLALSDILRSFPEGCMIVLDGREVGSWSAGTLVVRREMFAVVLIRVILCKCRGFVQPDVK